MNHRIKFIGGAPCSGKSAIIELDNKFRLSYYGIPHHKLITRNIVAHFLSHPSIDALKAIADSIVPPSAFIEKAIFLRGLSHEIGFQKEASQFIFESAYIWADQKIFMEYSLKYLQYLTRWVKNDVDAVNGLIVLYLASAFNMEIDEDISISDNIYKIRDLFRIKDLYVYSENGVDAIKYWSNIGFRSQYVVGSPIKNASCQFKRYLNRRSIPRSRALTSIIFLKVLTISTFDYFKNVFFKYKYRLE